MSIAWRLEEVEIEQHFAERAVLGVKERCMILVLVCIASQSKCFVQILMGDAIYLMGFKQVV